MTITSDLHTLTDNVDDSLDDLLDDLEPKQEQKKTNKTDVVSSSSPAASHKTETGERDDVTNITLNKHKIKLKDVFLFNACVCFSASSAARARRRDDLMFDDDEDDLMDALGFDETPKTQGTELIQKKERWSLVFQK